MNTDIRLSVGFWQHPKTKKTVKRLGLEGIRSLQVLWLWAAVSRPDGVLSGMDWEDIELAADWQGEERTFFECCLSADGAPMWIDESEGGYILHDWAEHNPWQAEAEARSESARKAAKARWGNAGASKAQKGKDADAMRSQCAGNADVSKAQCPSPLLSSPKPEEKNTNTQGTTGEVEPARAQGGPQGEFSDFSDTPGIEFQELRAFYDEHCRPEAPLTGFKEYKQLRASRRWPGMSRICDAIDAHARADPSGWKKFCPGLVKFLREHWWEKKPTARASPAQDESPLHENMQTSANVLAERQRRRQVNDTTVRP